MGGGTELILTATSFSSSIFSLSDGFVICDFAKQNRKLPSKQGAHHKESLRMRLATGADEGGARWCTLVRERRGGGKSDGKKSLVKDVHYLAWLCYNHISLSVQCTWIQGLGILGGQNGTWHSQAGELAQF